MDPSHPHHHLSDHVPGFVLLGGNTQAEAVALLGCYAALHHPKYNGKFLALAESKHDDRPDDNTTNDDEIDGFLVNTSSSRFPVAVCPGQRLDLEVHLDRLGNNMGKGYGHTSVLGQIACKVSKVQFVVIDPKK